MTGASELWRTVGAWVWALPYFLTVGEQGAILRMLEGFSHKLQEGGIDG